MLKLNFGCGSIQPEGWVNVDKNISFNSYAKVGNTFWSTTESFMDNEFDIIVAHAVVQQFEWDSMITELREFYRVLKPGGLLRISLPDIDRGFRNYILGNKDWFPNQETDIDSRFSSWLTWYSTSKTLMTAPTIVRFLESAGFPIISRVPFGQSRWALRNSVPEEEVTSLDTRQNEFYFIEAQK